MTDRPLGHLEITSKRAPKGVLLHSQFIDVVLNGKIIPGLQQIDIHLTADEFPIITLKFIPTSLEIDLEGVKTKVVKSMSDEFLVIIDAKLEDWIEKTGDELAIATDYVQLPDTCHIVDEMEELRLKIKERVGDKSNNAKD